MKNTAISRSLRFLEDHIALILGLFLPAWFGIFIAFVGVLDLLPKEVARKAEPQPMDIAFVTLGALIVCAVIAVLRMVRAITDGTSRRPIIYLLALDIIIMFFVFDTFAALQLKQDNANTTSNLSRISKRLYMYEVEHGSYPPQQDMKSLLETLGIQESDFIKTFFYDIYSAEYHAPPEDSNDPDETIITIRPNGFTAESDAILLFLRRDGSVGLEYLKDTASRPELKQKKERSAAIPEPDDEKQ